MAYFSDSFPYCIFFINFLPNLTLQNVEMKQVRKWIGSLQLCLDIGGMGNNSLTASSEFCHLLMIFANSLGPDQTRQNVGHDLDPSCLTL